MTRLVLATLVTLLCGAAFAPAAHAHRLMVEAWEEPGGAIAGKAFFEGGAPVANARVELLTSAAFAIDGREFERDAPLAEVGRSDSAGRFRVELEAALRNGLIAGAGKLVVRVRDHAGHRAEVAIALGAGGGEAGRVRSEHAHHDHDYDHEHDHDHHHDHDHDHDHAHPSLLQRLLQIGLGLAAIAVFYFLFRRLRRSVAAAPARDSA